MDVSEAFSEQNQIGINHFCLSKYRTSARKTVTRGIHA